MSKLFIAILVALIATAVSAITQIISLKKSESKIDFKLNIIVIAGLIINSALATWLLFGEQEEKDSESKKELQQFTTTLSQLQTANKQLISIVDSLRHVQDSISTINRMIGDQVGVQQRIGVTTKRIQTKTERLLVSQTEIYKNTDRALHPLFPVTLKVEFEIPFNSPGIKPLVDYINKLKDSVEANPGTTSIFLDGWDYIDNKLITLQFGNDMNILDSSLTPSKLLDPKLHIFLVKGTLKDFEKHNHAVPQMHFKVYNATNSEFRAKANLATKTIHFTMTYRNCHFVAGSDFDSNTFFGSNELLNCYILANIFTYNHTEAIIKVIKFYPVSGHLEKCFIRFEPEDVINRGPERFYYHKIVRRNYEYWDEDEQ